MAACRRPRSAAVGRGGLAAVAAVCVAAASWLVGGGLSTPAAAAAAAATQPAAAGSAAAAARFGPAPGPRGVEVMDLDWLDQDRNRPVPVRIFFPRRDAGPFPVVVMTAGQRRSRDSFDQLGRHLGSQGFIAVFVPHVDGDGADAAGATGAAGAAGARGGAGAGGGGSAAKAATATRKPAPVQAPVREPARDPHAGMTRLLDLVFALDQLFAMEATSPVLRGRIDRKQVAILGAGAGAWTALQAAGLASAGRDGSENSLPDPRVKALVLIAPTAVDDERRARLRFEHIRVPVLELTVAADRASPPVAAATAGGSAGAASAGRGVSASGGDRGASGAVAADRGAAAARSATQRFVYDQLRAGDAVWVTPAAVQARTVVTAFLMASLNRDAAARDWIFKGGLAAAAGAAGRVEARPAGH
jgi:hypothetical protein